MLFVSVLMHFSLLIAEMLTSIHLYIARLMNRSFTAFRCTPFWEFRATQMPKYERQLKEFLMLDLERALKEARDNAEEEDETLDLLRGKVVQVTLKGQTISPWRGSKKHDELNAG